MIYVIGESCTLDRDCVEECPADAIYVGNEQAFIHPGECIGCGQCVLVCPSAAIKPANALPPDWGPSRDAAEAVFRALGPTQGGSTRTEPVPCPSSGVVRS